MATGPEGSDLLIQLSFLRCHKELRSQARSSWLSERGRGAGPELSQRFYMWWPQNTGSAPLSPRGLETNPVNGHRRENKAGPAPEDLPSAPPTVVLRIHCSWQIWCRLCLLLCLLVSCCAASDDLPVLSPIVFLCFPFASGDRGL